MELVIEEYTEHLDRTSFKATIRSDGKVVTDSKGVDAILFLDDYRKYSLLPRTSRGLFDVMGSTIRRTRDWAELYLDEPDRCRIQLESFVEVCIENYEGLVERASGNYLREIESMVLRGDIDADEALRRFENTKTVGDRVSIGTLTNKLRILYEDLRAICNEDVDCYAGFMDMRNYLLGDYEIEHQSDYLCNESDRMTRRSRRNFDLGMMAYDRMEKLENRSNK